MRLANLQMCSKLMGTCILRKAKANGGKLDYMLTIGLVISEYKTLALMMKCYQKQMCTLAMSYVARFQTKQKHISGIQWSANTQYMVQKFDSKQHRRSICISKPLKLLPDRFTSLIGSKHTRPYLHTTRSSSTLIGNSSAWRANS